MVSAQDKDPTDSRLLMVLRVCAVVTAIGGVLAALVSVFQQPFDFDEVERAHSLWLVSQGQVPYTDFWELHPPVVWYLLAPFMKFAPEDPRVLHAGRLFALAGGVVLLWGLTKHLARGADGLQPWKMWAVSVMATSPSALAFLVEFRFDSWGYALQVWSALLYRREERQLRRGILYGALATLGVFIAPKTYLLPPLIVIADLVVSRPRGRRLGELTGGIAAGIAIGLCTLAVFMLAAGIDGQAALQCVLVYHLEFHRSTGFDLGLAKSLGEQTLPLILVLAGASCWITAAVSKRQKLASFDIALLIFLAYQVATVPIPYKQFYGPWLLLAAYFVTHLGPPLAQRAWKLALGVVIVTSLLVVGQATIYTLGHPRDAVAGHHLLSEAVLKLTPRGERVVAAPTFHPIFRDDVFYAWTQSFDPFGDHDSEWVARNRVPFLRPYFSREHYEAELKATPPVVFVFDPMRRMPEGQRAVVAEFLRAHLDDYAFVEVCGRPLAVRKDRLPVLNSLGR